MGAPQSRPPDLRAQRPPLRGGKCLTLAKNPPLQGQSEAQVLVLRRAGLSLEALAVALKRSQQVQGGGWLPSQLCCLHSVWPQTILPTSPNLHLCPYKPELTKRPSCSLSRGSHTPASGSAWGLRRVDTEQVVSGITMRRNCASLSPCLSVPQVSLLLLLQVSGGLCRQQPGPQRAACGWDSVGALQPSSASTLMSLAN